MLTKPITWTQSLNEAQNHDVACSALVAKQPALQKMMREDPELAQQLWIALVSKHNAKQ